MALNEEQARKDRADREAIACSLREKLSQGEKSLIGNKGYRKYAKTTAEGRFEIDKKKLEREAASTARGFSRLIPTGVPPR